MNNVWNRMLSSRFERTALVILIVSSMMFPVVARSEKRLDIDRLQYCQLAALVLTGHAQMLYEEGSNDVTWEEYSRWNEVSDHLTLLATFNDIPFPTENEFKRMVNLLWDKHGEKGAFDVLKVRTEQCLLEFPSIYVQ